jgi:zinc ribbon protein
MFCPNCATQNVEGASFCRVCGANISLVPQALTGQLPVAKHEEEYVDWRSRRRRGRQHEPTLDEAVRNLFMGIAFVVVSILVSKYGPGGSVWWFWLLIPAFTFFGKGVADLVRLKQNKQVAPTSTQPQINSMRPADLPAPRTGELMPPVSSVTEGTTRHLGAEAQTRHFDS